MPDGPRISSLDLTLGVEFFRGTIARLQSACAESQLPLRPDLARKTAVFVDASFRHFLASVASRFASARLCSDGCQPAARLDLTARCQSMSRESELRRNSAFQKSRTSSGLSRLNSTVDGHSCPSLDRRKRSSDKNFQPAFSGLKRHSSRVQE